MKSQTEKKVKVTFMIPESLWEEFKELVPPGKRSETATEALENELKILRGIKELEMIERFQEKLRKKYGTLPSSVDDIRRLREEGRDASIEDSH